MERTREQNRLLIALRTRGTAKRPNGCMSEAGLGRIMGAYLDKLAREANRTKLVGQRSMANRRLNKGKERRMQCLSNNTLDSTR